MMYTLLSYSPKVKYHMSRLVLIFAYKVKVIVVQSRIYGRSVIISFASVGLMDMAAITPRQVNLWILFCVVIRFKFHTK